MRETNLEITMVPVDALVPYENNAKIHTDKQIEHIAASIEAYGFNDPIGIWHNPDGEPEIVTGHGALMAAKRLGMAEVPCTYLDHMTDEERRVYCHVHNQTQLETGFDVDSLIADMDNLTADWENLGFEAYCYQEEDLGEVVEVEPPAVVECRCKPGDVWVLGDHRVLCGSATEESDYAKLLRGGVAQLLVTDPPYGVSYVGKTKDALTIEGDDRGDAELHAFIAQSLRLAMANMAPGAAFYIFHADSKGDVFRNAAREAGMRVRECLVWVKNVFVMGRQDYQWKHEPCLYGWKEGTHYFFDSRKESTVVEDGRPNIAKMSKADMRALLEEIYADKTATTAIHEDRPSVSAEHPTMKPVKLIARLIRNSSKPGWTVLDPFGGSGSTLIACEQLGRRCLTMEIDPQYCDVIIARWERLTGLTAEREA